jgi:flagellar hook-basal body complex protein FliE
MTISATAAAQAYSAAARAAQGERTAATQNANGAGGFGDLLQDAMQSIGDSAQRTNQATVAQVTGRADIVDVVTAVAETELAVQTLVSVRDRVISAYQEVMRMPI